MQTKNFGSVILAGSVALGGLTVLVSDAAYAKPVSVTTTPLAPQQNQGLVNQFLEWADVYGKSHPEIRESKYKPGRYGEPGKLEIIIRIYDGGHKTIHVIEEKLWYSAFTSNNGLALFEVRDYGFTGNPDNNPLTKELSSTCLIDGYFLRHGRVYEYGKEGRSYSGASIASWLVKKNQRLDTMNPEERIKTQQGFDEYFKRFLEILTEKVK
ncbi:hypothetical protein HY637_04530 [Candidatus Woesearchaeota archaeon]|nr:hypothetical protein [Candidatus Woesearchaeota archaeon]